MSVSEKDDWVALDPESIQRCPYAYVHMAHSTKHLVGS